MIKSRTEKMDKKNNSKLDSGRGGRRRKRGGREEEERSGKEDEMRIKYDLKQFQFVKCKMYFD